MYLGYFCHLELSKIVQSGHTGRDGKEDKIEREKDNSTISLMTKLNEAYQGFWVKPNQDRGCGGGLGGVAKWSARLPCTTTTRGRIPLRKTVFLQILLQNERIRGRGWTII